MKLFLRSISQKMWLCVHRLKNCDSWKVALKQTSTACFTLMDQGTGLHFLCHLTRKAQNMVLDMNSSGKTMQMHRRSTFMVRLCRHASNSRACEQWQFFWICSSSRQRKAVQAPVQAGYSSDLSNRWTHI